MDMRGAALTYFAFMKRHKEPRGVTSRNDVFRLYGTVGIVLNGLGNVLVMLPPPIPLVSSPSLRPRIVSGLCSLNSPII